MMALVWIRRHVPLQWRRPTARAIWSQIRDATALSGAKVGVGLYTTLVPLALGMVEGAAAVGYYAFADRVKQAAESALTPISQALFPRMSHLYANNTAAARRLLVQGGLCIAAAAGAISFVLWTWTEPIVVLLAGESFAPASVVLKWFALLPFILAFTNLFGMQVMLPNHRNTAYVAIFMAAGILGIGTLFPMVYRLGLVGAAINTFLTECFIMISMALYLLRKGFFSASTKQAGS
jgi:PST family polysaccharide transporter